MHGVLESLSDAFVSFDPEFRITYANAALMGMLKQYGIDGARIFGKKATEVIPDITETSLGQSLDRAMKERVPVDLEDFFPPFGRWFHARCMPTSDGGVSLFALDISEQKEGEQLLTRRANELGVLYGFADRLNRSLSSSEVYDEALETIGKALGCDRASILLFDKDGVMSFVAARGLSDEYKVAVTGHSPWKQGELGARPFGIDDIKNSDLDDHFKVGDHRRGIGALGFIPMLYNDVLIGKFMVYYDEPHAFTEHEFEIALTVGYQIAIGIERTRTQDALRENEERLRLATQTGKVGVWDWDIRANYVSWTESVYSMHGVARDGFDGSVEGFAALIHPDDRSFVNSRIQMALADEAPYEVEFRVALADGSVNWLFTNALVLRDAAGPYRMIGATIDVTERKLAEQELAKAAAIVDSSRDAIVSKDLSGIITSWNRGAEQVFGFASDEVIGKPITIIIPEDRLNEEKENIGTHPARRAHRPFRNGPPTQRRYAAQHLAYRFACPRRQWANYRCVKDRSRHYRA
jgi:PAS domain S-box-containing protein